ncbi:hypothetical protein MMYC01_207974 [Madurella mycetomatis]|uniref:Uncharacterized protein n=1 Tax=Madurella mycetomatis TaxID=100816 RepID=A0A175VUT5_9PEZI|nr:hypothetical protein MMYC01_207974 [Madurella mycetomatis]
MASLWPHILQRNADSGVHPNLTAGAIAGISCGAAALFLGAVGLFIIYWHRLRDYDREENFYECKFGQGEPPGSISRTLTYTMDYKMGRHQEDDPGSSSAYSPEKPAYPFSPLSTCGSASAMPTHPAYIPRAVVRGTTTSSTRSIASPTPPLSQLPSPGMAVISASSKSRSDGAAIRKASFPPPYSGPGPQLQGSKPLHGRENTTISGPLAFPEYYQAPQPPLPTNRDRDRERLGGGEHEDGGGETNRQPFRNRVFSWEGEQQGQAKPARGKKKYKESRQSPGGNRHYAEIEIGRGSDIW